MLKRVTKMTLSVRLLLLFLLLTSVGCEIDWRTDVHEQLQILTGYVQDIEAKRDLEIADMRTTIADQSETITDMRTTIADQSDTITGMQLTIADQSETILGMRTTIADQSETITDMRTTIAEQSETILGMRATISDQSETITTLQAKVDSLTPATKHDEYISYGCYGDTLTLNCSGNTVIQVNSAYYGNFANCSDGTCCVPDPGNDCQEHVETSNDADWDTLLEKCHNKASCEIINAGGILQSCEPVNVEYLTIRYYCETLDAVIGTVGFTAYATTDMILDPPETVIFNGVVSNYGDAYDTTTGEFTCPVTGIYMFAVNHVSENDYRVHVYIMMGSSVLMASFSAETGAQTGSATVFTTCQQGEIVYVRATDDLYTGQRLKGGTTDRRSSFAGFLVSVA